MIKAFWARIVGFLIPERFFPHEVPAFVPNDGVVTVLDNRACDEMRGWAHGHGMICKFPDISYNSFSTRLQIAGQQQIAVLSGAKREFHVRFSVKFLRVTDAIHFKLRWC